MTYDTNMHITLSTDSSIHLQIEQLTVVSPVNDIYYYLLLETRMIGT